MVQQAKEAKKANRQQAGVRIFSAATVHLAELSRLGIKFGERCM